MSIIAENLFTLSLRNSEISQHLLPPLTTIVAEYEGRLVLPMGTESADINRLLALFKPKADQLDSTINRLHYIYDVSKWSNDPVWDEVLNLVYGNFGYCTLGQFVKMSEEDKETTEKLKGMSACLYSIERAFPCDHPALDLFAYEFQDLINQCYSDLQKSPSKTAKSVEGLLRDFYHNKDNVRHHLENSYLKTQLITMIPLRGLPSFFEALLQAKRIQIPAEMLRMGNNQLRHRR